jgi:hypothetical protein
MVSIESIPPVAMSRFTVCPAIDIGTLSPPATSVVISSEAARTNPQGFASAKQRDVRPSAAASAMRANTFT